tara:strand:- start:188 stop:580 length:393 start_codon:yes stop_codon:yes gene_type:complete
MGILDTYNNTNFGNVLGSGGNKNSGRSSNVGNIFGYSSVNEVRRAYDENKLSYNAAYRILMDEFNLSDLDIQDVLIIEPPQYEDDDDDTLLPKPEEEEEEEKEIIPFTDNERFLIIGIVVTAGLYGFIKK